MAELKETSCCGLYEIDGLMWNSPKENLLDVCADKYDYSYGGVTRQAFLMFTDAVGNKNGSKLASFIRKHGLGVIYETRPRTNPNSRNRIQVWVWGPDERALKSWWKKNRPEDEDYDY